MLYRQCRYKVVLLDINFTNTKFLKNLICFSDDIVSTATISLVKYNKQEKASPHCWNM